MLPAIIWLFTIILVLILRGGIQKTVQDSKNALSPSLLTWFAVFTSFWIIYLIIISFSGALNDFGLPPRLPLLVILPIFVALGFVLIRPLTNTFCRNISISWLIGFQGFRIIVELIIWQAYNENILPKETTFEGMNYDVLVGITAIPIALMADKKKLSRSFIFIWNVLGLLILANTVRVFVSSAYFPGLLGYDHSIVDKEFLQPPNIFIAGLFMPLAVFVHALSIKKLFLK